MRQEAGNIALALMSPDVSVEEKSPLSGLPPPHAIRARLLGTAFAAEVQCLAGEILGHRLPLLGMTIDTGAGVHWRQDYAHGMNSKARYFRLIPYLNFRRVGDHKVIWELNRHQHLVLLAQAWLLTNDPRYYAEIARQWESWVAENPFQRSINWASALEVAFRALSWIWIYHLTGCRMEPTWRRSFLRELYRHGLHIERNLSIYFSPNTHLLGEAVALHALGALFPVFPRARRWARTGGKIVRQELQRQVRADGAHFEQSSYYHVYALDFFLLHYQLAGRPESFRPVLIRMAEYLDALVDGDGRMPFLGDDDGGRVFHPYGRRDGFGRATLATCAVLLNRPEWLRSCEDLQEQAVWWTGENTTTLRTAPSVPNSSRLFPQTGTAILRAGEAVLTADVGGFGPFRAGHSHSDTLSVVLKREDEEILIDPGTYTYIGDPHWRNWFRGSAAHNTVRVDGRDQAVPLGPFGWSGRPETGVHEWNTTESCDFLDAWCRYSIAAQDITQRRRILFLKPDVILIIDEIQGSGERLIEQFWHAGAEVTPLGPRCFRIGSQARLAVAPDALVSVSIAGEHGWRSRAYGEKSPAPVVCVSCRSALPVFLPAALVLSGDPAPLAITFVRKNDSLSLKLEGDRSLTVHFAAQGVPQTVWRAKPKNQPSTSL